MEWLFFFSNHKWWQGAWPESHIWCLVRGCHVAHVLLPPLPYYHPSFITFHRRIVSPEDQLPAGSIRAADFIRDLGYSTTDSVDRFRAALGQCIPLSVEEVARLIGMMASTYTGLYLAEKPRDLHLLQSAWLSPSGEGVKEERFTWCLPVVVSTIHSLVHIHTHTHIRTHARTFTHTQHTHTHTHTHTVRSCGWQNNGDMHTSIITLSCTRRAVQSTSWVHGTTHRLIHLW
jgi:hypothetical protein